MFRENWEYGKKFGEKSNLTFRSESTWNDEVVQEITCFGCSFNKASGCISHYFVNPIKKALSYTF